ncbi:MAG: glycosyltransferase family 1 protein [Marinilabiliales bacterium]|nr:MAG: glycosyltransferase family 1 protein [Marinilabiliales bacterium]
MPNKVICFFNSAETWGGGEKWHYDIATRLHLKGYKIIVITNKKSELYLKLAETDIKTYPIKISNFSFLNPFKVKSVSQILKKEKVSTIIINLPSDLKVAGPASRKAEVSKIIYRRGSAIPIKNKLSNRILFKKYIDEIIANSEATKNTILSKNPNLFDKNKIKIIYNGIILDKKDTTEPIYNRQKDELIIGNAGRFVRQKNHSFLIRLASKLKNEGINFKILLAGSGKLQPEIEGLAKELNVDDQIIFTGFVENIKSFMESIDIYVLPSFWEGFGYVLVEAMACKKPVIAFNLSSNPEIIANKTTGFLVEENDLEALTEKIKLLAEDSELRAKMGLEGEKRVKKLFLMDRVVEEIEKIII